MKTKATNRGFLLSHFIDAHNQECSIQESSIATEARIWLGIDNPDVVIFDKQNAGRYVVTAVPENWSINSRMELNQKQVKDLLPLLIHFAEHGNLPS